ncbi:MAG TPA: hypothetical protein VI997_11950 [Candidatus Thermoplasmatota archaeon]|nr:hypothetical protein [Candidatus Thermoplasmatota archaeon]
MSYASARWRVVHEGVPLALVLTSVAILAIGAVSTVVRWLPQDAELALLGAGIAAWIAGIGWGVLVND